MLKQKGKSPEKKIKNWTKTKKKKIKNEGDKVGKCKLDAKTDKKNPEKDKIIEPKQKK